jgi:hypothetical protein
LDKTVAQLIPPNKSKRLHVFWRLMLKNECIKTRICLKQRKKMDERSKRIKYRWTTYSLRKKKERKRKKKGRVTIS